MISEALEIFVNDVMAEGRIGPADMRRLHREVLPNGIATRDEVDVLVALDRALHDKSSGWTAFLLQAAVEFVVWQSRPTGIVDRETARWLTTSLACGTGPSDLAMAIAFEIVRECEQADEVLVAFVMRHSRGRHAAMDMADLALDQAA